jgi:biopolymer transport protein ExbD
MARRRRRIETAAVRPEFPVIPLMAVIFLLFAYPVALTRVGPVEGFITIRGPKEGHSEEMLREDDRRRGIPVPTEYIATVTAGPDGTVGAFTIREEREPAGSPPLGAGIDQYRAELTSRWRGLRGHPGRLVLEIGDGIRYGTTVKLLDVSIQAGFEDVDLFPADERKR